MLKTSENLSAYLTRLGDNALILGQQMGAWVSKAPILEEEMAVANFALDYVGQARMFYSVVGELGSHNKTEDQLAFTRDVADFHNLLLVEQPNGNFADTVARQFLFESFYYLQLEALVNSSDERVAEIARKSLKEIDYHLQHMRQWLLRLGDGTAESREKMQSAIDRLWRYTGEMFTSDDLDAWAAEQNIGPDVASLRERYLDNVAGALRDATLDLPEEQWMASGGKQGRHTEHLGYLLAEMQFLQRAYPASAW